MNPNWKNEIADRIRRGESRAAVAADLFHKRITAQDLYDRRDERGEIEGTELHEVFQFVCGEPSPTGRVEIDTAALSVYASVQRQSYASHKAAGGVGGEYLLDVAKFCESFA